MRREELAEFSRTLFDAYDRAFGGAHNAMMRMKGHWQYWVLLLAGSEKLAKQLRKTNDPRQFRLLTEQAVETFPLLETPAVDW